MKSWQQELNNIPTGENGKKQITEPESELIVLKFLKEEIYPRFETLKSELSSKDLKVEISPESQDNISIKNLSTSIHIQNNSTRNKISLNFKQEPDLIILSTFFEKTGYANICSIGIDSPNYIELIDSSIDNLKESIK